MILNKFGMTLLSFICLIAILALSDDKTEAPQKIVFLFIDDLNKDAEQGEYLTDHLTEEACSFISSDKDQSPFFSFFSDYTVHTQLEPREDLESKGKNSGRGAALDKSVNRKLSKIKKEQLNNHTIVVFTFDDGRIFCNEPLRSKKGSAYEGGIGVPMTVKWPGVTEPVYSGSVPVISTDSFPSFIEIGAGNPEKNSAIFNGVSRIASQLARVEQFAKINYKLIEKFTDGTDELYDLSNDIAKSRNLAAQIPEKADELLNDLIA